MVLYLDSNLRIFSLFSRKRFDIISLGATRKASPLGEAFVVIGEQFSLEIVKIPSLLKHLTIVKLGAIIGA